MAELTRDEFKKEYDERVKKIIGSRNREVGDDVMAKAVGGVGKAGQATCAMCGKPMIKYDSGYGSDPIWKCETCKYEQFLDDAETVEILKAMETAYGADYLKSINAYPVRWDKIK